MDIVKNSNEFFHSFKTFLNNIIVKNNVKTAKDIIDTTLLYNLLVECDPNYFPKKLNLTFDKSFGMLFTEISEIVVLTINYIEKSGVNLTPEFDFNLKGIKAGLLINEDINEIQKLIDLLILTILICSNKDDFIDKLLSLDENIHSDILNVFEKYVYVDDKDNNQRLSLYENNTYNNTNNNTDNQNFVDITRLDSNTNNNIIADTEAALKKEKLLVIQLQDENNKLKVRIDNNNQTIYENEENIKNLEKKIVKLSIDNESLNTNNYKLTQEIDTLKKEKELIESLSLSKQREKELLNNIEDLKNDIISKEKAYNRDISQLENKIERFKNKLANFEALKPKLENYDMIKEKINNYELLISSNFDKSIIDDIKIKYDKEVKIKNERIRELELSNDKLESLIEELKDKNELIMSDYNDIKKRYSNVIDINSNSNINNNNNNNNKEKKNNNNNNNIYNIISEEMFSLIKEGSNDRLNIYNNNNNNNLTLDNNLEYEQNDMNKHLFDKNNNNNITLYKNSKQENYNSNNNTIINNENNCIFSKNKKQQQSETAADMSNINFKIEKNYDIYNKNMSNDLKEKIETQRKNSLKAKNKTLKKKVAFSIKNIECLSKDDLFKEFNIVNNLYSNKIYEVDYLKKEICDLKERYEKEFEIMSSCIYSIGIQYYIVKNDFSIKLNENPPWIVKERQKLFNGDF